MSNFMESFVDAMLDWSSPDDGPVLVARIQATHLRNELTEFTVMLPPDLALIGKPKVVSGSFTDAGDDSDLESSDARWRVVVGKPRNDGKGNGKASGSNSTDSTSISGWVPVLARRIPASSNRTEQDRDAQSAVMTLRLRLSNANFTANNPLLVRLPLLSDALSSEGQLQIITSDSSQLRWRIADGIAAVRSEDENGVATQYQFQFNAPESVLPIWLSRQLQRKPLRVSGTLEVSHGEERLELRIQSVAGPLTPESIRLVAGDWRLVQVVPVDSDATTGGPVVDRGGPGGVSVAVGCGCDGCTNGLRVVLGIHAVRDNRGR